MQLKNLIDRLPVLEQIHNTDMPITGICFDSRKVEPSCLFVAINGANQDGHAFIDTAIEKGATVIVCEEIPAHILPNIVYIKVADTAEALGTLASAWYENPSQKLKLIGITGTNGKTTCATLLYDTFTAIGYSCVLISTIKIKISTQTIPSAHTTPDVLKINEILHMGVENGCEYAFMEVSSHGIEQKRIAGLHFSIAGFTNITHDHLDYHKTFKNYLTAKKTFFDHLDKRAIAITNLDDPNGLIMLQNTAAQRKSYAIKTLADYHGKILEKDLKGMLLLFNGNEFWTHLTGRFNAYNLLLVFAIANLSGIDETTILVTLSKLTNVDGRFQTFISPQGIIVIVDYAHTPDALENVLSTIQEMRTQNEKLITVFGCGGDRDREKRPQMGEIASKYSDISIITSDNPRTEKPEDILQQIIKGIPTERIEKYLSITDRAQAIKTALTMSNAKDIVLIAGKGHENYQEINNERTYFNDIEMAKKLLNELKK